MFYGVRLRYIGRWMRFAITLIRFRDILVLCRTFCGVSVALTDLYMFRALSIKPIECGYQCGNGSIPLVE